MSHYTRIKAKFSNRDAIVTALTAIGFKPEVHDAPVHLYGIGGKLRPESAQVVVPRLQICGSANDLGFVYNPETNAYDMIISEFDARWGKCAPGMGLGREFQSRFAFEYAIAAINQEGQFVVEKRQRLDDGSWQMVVTKVQAYEGLDSETTIQSSFSQYTV